MWNGSITGSAYATWDNAPGGKIVERYTDPNTGLKYVLVEFEKTPGTFYVYFA